MFLALELGGRSRVLVVLADAFAVIAADGEGVGHETQNLVVSYTVAVLLAGRGI